MFWHKARAIQPTYLRHRDVSSLLAIHKYSQVRLALIWYVYDSDLVVNQFKTQQDVVCANHPKVLEHICPIKSDINRFRLRKPPKVLGHICRIGSDCPISISIGLGLGNHPKCWDTFVALGLIARLSYQWETHLALLVYSQRRRNGKGKEMPIEGWKCWKIRWICSLWCSVSANNVCWYHTVLQIL